MILETDRLILREMTEEDYESLYAATADSDATKHYSYGFSARQAILCKIRDKKWLRAKNTYNLF